MLVMVVLLKLTLGKSVGRFGKRNPYYKNNSKDDGGTGAGFLSNPIVNEGALGVSKVRYRRYTGAMAGTLGKLSNVATGIGLGSGDTRISCSERVSLTSLGGTMGGTNCRIASVS